MADLSVNLHGIKLKNPIMPASGPLVRNYECMMKCAKSGVSALNTKTISEMPVEIPIPCMQEISEGVFLNSELWSEISAEEWMQKEFSRSNSLGIPRFVSIGYTAEEIERLAPIVAPYADVIEISTHYMDRDIEPVIRAIKAASKYNKPVYVKISPGINKIGWYVKRLVEEGADGFVAINSIGPCLNIDVETGLPFIGSSKGYGWLSGKAINPIALRYVYSIANSVKVPIIGVGGISSGEDVAAMMMAGASAVQICTEAVTHGYSAYSRIIQEFNQWLDTHNYKNASDLIGITAMKIKDRKLNTKPIIPSIDNIKCTACAECMRSCVYDAITIKSKAEINKAFCFGCGLCVTRCPEKAIIL